MASSKPSTDQMLTTKHLPRPSLLLKDYLRDDLSSCSSSGFKSFPRRQCCTTVRFLLEKDLQAKRKRLLRPNTSKRRSSKAVSSTISALQKASQAVINAVKLLPFPSISATPLSSSSQKKNAKKGLFSRSLSRKVLSSSSWRKAVKEETRRWRSFRELLEEGDKASDQNTQISSMSVTLESTNSGSGNNGSGSSRKSNGNSWGGSEFSWEILRSSSGNSESSTENDVVGSKDKNGSDSSEDSTEGRSITKTRDWGSEEKEQFSPVSILDCPFEDDEEIISPSDSACSRLQGTKHKQMQKSGHFAGCMASLKPVELEKRMALPEVEDEAYKQYIPICNDKSKVEEKAWSFIKEVKTSVPISNSSLIMSKAEEKVLFDLFKQISNEERTENQEEKERELYKIAVDWISGESQLELNLGWEAREVYIKEMDKRERWTNISDQQLAMDLEFEVFTSLVNELVLELTSP